MRLLAAILGHKVWIDPELDMACVEGKAERKAILDEARKRSRGRTAILVSAVCIAISAIIIICLFLALRYLGFLWTSGLTAITLWNIGAQVIITGVTAVGGAWYWRRRAKHVVRQILIERGYAVCRGCGYDLRGQTEPRCPECGAAFDPAILDNSRVPADTGDGKVDA